MGGVGGGIFRSVMVASAVAVAAVFFSGAAFAEGGLYGVGRPAGEADIRAWDIDVRWDGEGLPPGGGTVAEGEIVYEAKCASCHGDFGQGEGRWPAIAGGFDSLTHQGGSQRPEKTFGSYWPFAPTLFDYIRRAMPYTAPQSLSDGETYALVAYILYLNDLVGEDFTADAETVAAVRMPNRENFFDDPRPDVRNSACMTNCLDAGQLRLIESITGVTPEQESRGGDGESDDAKPAAETVAAPAPASYAVCGVCHASGVADAPLLSDTAEWQKRLDASGGVGALTQAVIQGKGAMPPKGGAANLSDEEIEKLVRYMLQTAKIAVE